MKKVLLTLGALAVAVAVVPMFAAFEAHVINVTARIENALSVPVEPINFGTVFPQEYLERELPITFSRSFVQEGDADDVEYVIRQKPKCGVTSQNGEVLDGPTWTGHVVPVSNNPATSEDESKGGTAYTIDCKRDEPAGLSIGPNQSAGLLPLLCPYLSKHERSADGLVAENDSSLNAFHHPWVVSDGVVSWTEASGRLAKSHQDFDDLWVIDLAVPCFGDHCAQDWATFVGEHNSEEEGNADAWVADIKDEHKVFGCNLWIEVTGVSRL
jgi:hypothetical protein